MAGTVKEANLGFAARALRVFARAMVAVVQRPKVSGPMPALDEPEESGTWDETLLSQAIEMAVTDGQVSTSVIQRRLKIGYARAGRLVDEMERRGIVSAKDGAKPRLCLITRDEFERMKREDDLTDEEQ